MVLDQFLLISKALCHVHVSRATSVRWGAKFRPDAHISRISLSLVGLHHNAFTRLKHLPACDTFAPHFSKWLRWSLLKELIIPVYAPVMVVIA